MADFQIKIDSILGGISPNPFQGTANQFHASIGVDPDLAIDDGTAIRTSGVLRPSGYSKFSSTGLTGYPLWIMTPASGDTVYTYASDGKLLEYSTALSAASELVIGTPSAGAGNGGAFYNNYIYCATNSSVARFGPVSATAPAFDNDFWGDTLAKTGLRNPTYPASRSVTLPNHPLHVHSDGRLYIGDYDNGSATDTTRGFGLIHFIKTKYGTLGATTGEGAINSTVDASTYNALTLPPNYMPTDIESFGENLVIAAIPSGSATTFIGGRAKLFFWDTIASNFYRSVELLDPVCTALLNLNGNLYIWSGNMNNGVRVSVYSGGYSIKQLAFFEEGFSPPAGAVDGIGNRISWGAFTTYPENTASVYSLGYKDSNLPLALHNIINSTAAATASNGMVTAIKYAQQASFIYPRLVVGWRDAANFGLDKLGATYGVSLWRSLQYQIGKSFIIRRIILPLGAAVGASMTLVPTIFVDDGSSSTALTTINSTNFPNSERRISYIANVEGKNNFFLQIRWSGTALLPITFPIIIEGETIENATR